MFESTFSTLLFTVLKVICWAINRLTQLFEVFSGLTKVRHNGEDTFLFDVFLNNSTVNNIYWGMALIGLILCFGFAIFSVARKMFDLNNKNPLSTGQIITETIKSFFLIISMSLILTISITVTDVLLRQINYMFTKSGSLDTPDVMEYTDEQYAAMGRSLSTIANYGMNPSYNSRYNVNDCFNTIRQDLIYLEEQGVFDYNYQTSGVNSWQSALQEVANSADLRYELKSDVYYEKVVAAIEHVLEIMKNDASFRPLEKFERYRSGNLNDIPLDRIVFLVGTLDSANNNYFNVEPSFDDALRGPYYTGEKSLYDTDKTSSMDVISGDFNINFSKFDYLVSYVLGIAVLYNTFVILLNLAARMFNILFLYIIAPPVLASRPLDGGAKTKQWMTAFLVQLLGVFGHIIVMRLLLIFIPVIFDPSLVLIQNNNMLNYFGKAIILIAAYAVAKKAGSLLSGILTDTAGMQSAQAGDMSSVAQRSIGTARRMVGGAVRTAGAAVTGAVGFAAAPLLNKMRKPFEEYKRLGSGPSSSEIARQAKERMALESKMNELRGSGSGEGNKKNGRGDDGPQPPSGGSSRANVNKDKNENGDINQGSAQRGNVQNDISSQMKAQRSKSVSQPQSKRPSVSGVGTQSVKQPDKQQSDKKQNGPSGPQQKSDISGSQQKNNVSGAPQQGEVPQEKSGNYGQSDMQSQSNENDSQGLDDSQFSSFSGDYEPDNRQFDSGSDGQEPDNSQFSSFSGDYEPDNRQFGGSSDAQQQGKASQEVSGSNSQQGSLGSSFSQKSGQPSSGSFSQQPVKNSSQPQGKVQNPGTTGKSASGQPSSGSFSQQSAKNSSQPQGKVQNPGTTGKSASGQPSSGTVSSGKQTSASSAQGTRQRNNNQQGPSGSNSKLNSSGSSSKSGSSGSNYSQNSGQPSSGNVSSGTQQFRAENQGSSQRSYTQPDISQFSSVSGSQNTQFGGATGTQQQSNTQFSGVSGTQQQSKAPRDVSDSYNQQGSSDTNSQPGSFGGSYSQQDSSGSSYSQQPRQPSSGIYSQQPGQPSSGSVFSGTQQFRVENQGSSQRSYTQPDNSQYSSVSGSQNTQFGEISGSQQPNNTQYSSVSGSQNTQYRGVSGTQQQNNTQFSGVSGTQQQSKAPRETSDSYNQQGSSGTSYSQQGSSGSSYSQPSSFSSSNSQQSGQPSSGSVSSGTQQFRAENQGSRQRSYTQPDNRQFSSVSGSQNMQFGGVTGSQQPNNTQYSSVSGSQSTQYRGVSGTQQQNNTQFSGISGTHQQSKAQQYTQPSQQTSQTRQQYTQPSQQYTQPSQQTTQRSQQYTQPSQQTSQTRQQYTQPSQQTSQTRQQYTQPSQQYTQPSQQTTQHSQQYTQPSQQTSQTSQQYTQPSQQTTQRSQQYTQPSRQNNAQQSNINDFMRQTYRRYGEELNKKNDSE